MYWRILIIVLCIAFVPGNSFAGAKIEKLKKEAQEGSAQAQFSLGAAYDFGKGVKQNLEEAAKWYARAADQGLPEAQNALGSLYQSGDGVPEDYKKSFELYKKSADQGYDSAISSLGYMYDLGLGVEEDNVKAVELYKIAADHGHLPAMLNLALMYVNGDGVEKDPVEGFKWIELARFYTTTSKDMKLKWRIRGVFDPLKAQLTKEQIKEGKRRATAWSKNHSVPHQPVSKYAPDAQN